MPITFTETGQTGQAVTWGDGSYDRPELVLMSCDQCGATVPSNRVDLHAASHA